MYFSICLLMTILKPDINEILTLHISVILIFNYMFGNSIYFLNYYLITNKMRKKMKFYFSAAVCTFTKVAISFSLFPLLTT